MAERAGALDKMASANNIDFTVESTAMEQSNLSCALLRKVLFLITKKKCGEYQVQLKAGST